MANSSPLAIATRRRQRHDCQASLPIIPAGTPRFRSRRGQRRGHARRTHHHQWQSCLAARTGFRDPGWLVEEQSALRRVATLVARAGPPSLVFEAVTREVGLLCDADLARMERYEDDGTVTGVAVWGRVPAELAVGTRFALDGVSIARGVKKTGGQVRVDRFGDDPGAIAAEARALGIRSSVGCPIVVGGGCGG